MFHRFQEFGIFLTHDLVEKRCLHSRSLHLLERLTGVDALMLAGVSDQKNPVLRANLFEEVAHLASACERRLIDHVKVLYLRINVLVFSKETLQSAGVDLGVAELARCPAGGRETLDDKAALFCALSY